MGTEHRKPYGTISESFSMGLGTDSSLQLVYFQYVTHGEDGEHHIRIHTS
jgi:hypothetical protein